MNTREQYKAAWQIVRQSTHPMRLPGMTQAQYIEFCCALISVPHSIRLAAGKSWSLREYHSADLMRQNLRDKAVDRLTAQYKAEIRESLFNWEIIVAYAKSNPIQDFYGNDESHGSEYLGSIMSLVPSGKFWMFWANNNVSALESMKDTAFMEALESVASEHDGWIEHGEGDPTDLFFCIAIDSEDSND